MHDLLDSRRSRRDVQRVNSPQASPDPRPIAKHCPFGALPKRNSLEHGPTTIISRAGYVLEHYESSKIAPWICESMRSLWDLPAATRKKPFAPDANRARKPHVELADYRGSRFDRWYMALSAAGLRTQPLTISTFFLLYTVPENEPLNQTYWARPEADSHLGRRWRDPRRDNDYGRVLL